MMSEESALDFSVVEDDGENVTIEISEEDYQRDLAAGIDEEDTLKRWDEASFLKAMEEQAGMTKLTSQERYLSGPRKMYFVLRGLERPSQRF